MVKYQLASAPIDGSHHCSWTHTSFWRKTRDDECIKWQGVKPLGSSWLCSERFTTNDHKLHTKKVESRRIAEHSCRCSWTSSTATSSISLAFSSVTWSAPCRCVKHGMNVITVKFWWCSIVHVSEYFQTTTKRFRHLCERPKRNAIICWTYLVRGSELRTASKRSSRGVPRNWSRQKIACHMLLNFSAKHTSWPARKCPSILQDRFSGIQLKVEKLYFLRAKEQEIDSSPWPCHVTLSYWSPQLYDFICSLLTMPSPWTISRWLNRLGLKQ